MEYCGKKYMVLRRLIVSYLLILIIFLIFWGSVYGVMQYRFEKQTYSLNESILMSFQNEIDKRITAVNTTGTLAALDTCIFEYISESEKRTLQEQAYEAFHVKQKLESYRSGNSYIQDIYIYQFESERVISSNTIAKASLFYDISQDYLDESLSQWQQRMLAIKDSRYEAYTSFSGKNEINLVYSLPVSSGTSSKTAKAALVIVLDEGVFEKIATQYCEGNGVAFTIKRKNLNLSYPKTQDTRDYYKTINISSKTSTTSYSISIPKDIYRKQQDFLFIFLIISLVIYIVIFTYILIRSIKRYYNPLRDLIVQIKTTINDSDSGYLGEYVYLQHAFHDVMDQQYQNEERIRHQMEHLRRSYLTQLFTGTLKATDIDKNEQISFLKEFLYPKYFLVLFKAQENEKASLTIKELGISSEKCKDGVQGIGVRIGQVFVLLLNGTGLNADCITHKIELLREKIAATDPNANIVVSSVHDMKNGINKVYSEMFYMLQCMDAFGKHGELTYENKFERREFCWCSKEEEIHLMNAVKSQNQTKITAILTQMWNRAAGNGVLMLEEAKVLLIGQINILYKTVNEINPSLVQQGFPVSYFDLLQIDTMDEMKQVLNDAVIKVLALMREQSEQKEDESDRIVREAKAYIGQHYSNQNLSVEMLCQSLGRSVSGVSKVFKDRMGVSILYYMNEVRVQKAKDMISQSNGTIRMNELYEKAGFGSINTFIRVFKKYEGITPGSYVENHQSLSAVSAHNNG